MRERAGEMPEKTLLRRRRDRICKESMRASETCEESSERRKQNRTRMMSTRASETCEETTERRESQIVPRVCTLVLFIIIMASLTKWCY